MPGSPDISGIRHLSYSSASAYLLCGRYWRFRYVDKMPAAVSPAVVFGGAFHNTLETYIRGVAEGAESMELTAVWKHEWGCSLVKEGENVDWGDRTPEAMWRDGVRILQTPEVAEAVSCIRPLIGANGHIHIEDYVSFEVPGVPVPIIGYIDMIDAEGIPCDFKTSSRRWSQNDAESELQPLFYLAALCQSGYQLNPAMYFRHHVFATTNPARAECIETRWAPGELDFLAELLREVWRGISNGVFVPNARTWKCSQRWCEYWAICRGRAYSQ